MKNNINRLYEESHSLWIFAVDFFNLISLSVLITIWCFLRIETSPRTKKIKAFLLLDQSEADIEPPVCYELHCKFPHFSQYKD